MKFCYVLLVLAALIHFGQAICGKRICSSNVKPVCDQYNRRYNNMCHFSIARCNNPCKYTKNNRLY